MRQETLEEVAHKMLIDYGILSIGQSVGVLEVKKLMAKMAKWQQEQDKDKFSEEEVIQAFEDGMNNVNYDDFHITTKQWFEQFKKKINLNCNDCNKSLQDCTCMEDTIDMKQETLEDVMLRKAEWRLGLI